MRHVTMLTAMVLGLVTACGDIGNPLDPTDDKEPEPTYDACDTSAVNKTAADALPMIEGEEVIGRFCRRVGMTRPWFRHSGTFVDGQKFRLTVKFDRGELANDLDFSLGVLNGNGVSGGTVVAGSCHNPAGQPEDCTTQVSGASDTVYIRVDDNIPEETNEEVFRLTIHKIATE